MAERELCCNAWGKAKIAYKTRAAAEKAARRTKSGKAIHVYRCLYGGDHFHLTSREQYEKIPVLSPAKLRRKLANVAREIADAQRRLEESERQVAMARAHEADEILACQKMIANWRQ